MLNVLRKYSIAMPNALNIQEKYIGHSASYIQRQKKGKKKEGNVIQLYSSKTVIEKPDTNLVQTYLLLFLYTQGATA